MKTEWSIEELADHLNVTVRGIRKRAGDQNWPVQHQKKLRGGGSKYFFRFDDLPKDVQVKLVAQEPPPASVAINASLPAPTSDGRSDGRLPDWAETIARARADLVVQFIAAREQGKRRGQSIRKTTDKFLAGYNSGVAFAEIHAALGDVSRPTLNRWRKDYEEADFNYTALAPSWGAHRNGASTLTADEQKVLFDQLAHQNRIKVGTAIQLTKYILEQRGIPSPSSPRTMRRAVERFKKQHQNVWTFYREGEKALIDKVLPYIERDDDQLAVGDVLVADGHVCNFFVTNPWTGRPCRPMLIGFYDWKSRVLVGWDLGFTENTQLIASALRRGILTLGMTPKVVLLDNGKAFKSKVFTGDLDLAQCGFAGMFARLNIKTVFAWPYNARSKPIERFFQDFGNQFERYLPSFCGSSINDKPASMMRNEKLMKEMYDNAKAKPLDVQTVLKGMGEWWKYHAWQPHPTLKGQTKGDVFEAGRGADVDPETLTYLMMDAKVKRIGRNGIRFLHADYFHDALYGFRNEVVIRYDLQDISRIHVYLKTGDHLCTAERRKAIHPMAAHLGDAQDVSELKHRISEIRSLKNQTTRLAKKSLQIQNSMDAVNELPWNRIIEISPDLPDQLERISGEHDSANAAKQIPEVSASTQQHEEIQQGPDTLEPDSPGPEENIVPLFSTEYEYYEYLADKPKNQLTQEETEWLETFYQTETGAQVLRNSGRAVNEED
ncbi:Mu transposase C-terminal domain-containing protein [Nitrospina gracilis]|uniref:Mu transposase C-terminal domain-containing protein n=1 Tax=Nitrospina gracilis TaxID=35801 RepID=UPI001F2DF3C1|nr:Mu transposase C-terminal domain-containing protein [Nitrospina gracilis]MCF8719251.1 putative transposase [Nitrospina gracilis Nb-211]